MGKIKQFILDKGWITADLITYLRLLLFSPLVIFFTLKENYLVAFILFILGSLTDALDGYVARLKNQTKESGIFLDAATDKIFILPPFLILGFKFLDSRIVVLLFSLEVFHASLVILGKAVNFPLRIAANIPGKIKMGFESLGIAFLLLNAQKFLFLASFFFIVAIIFAILSLVLHLIKNLRRK